MAIIMRATIAGMTKEQYDGMAADMLPKLKDMPGFLAHAGGPIPGGFEVVEFWESQEQLDAWLKGTALPDAAAAGLTPIVTVLPGRNVIVRRHR